MRLSRVIFGVVLVLLVTGGDAAKRLATSAPSTKQGWRINLQPLLAGTPRDQREVYVAVADIDGDGKKELVAVRESGRAQVWQWKGSGFASIFGPAKLLAWGGIFGKTVYAADLDDDRREEIVLSSDTGLGDAAGVQLRAYAWTATHGRSAFHSTQVFTRRY